MLRLHPIGADMVLHDHAMEDCLFRHAVPYSIRTMVRSQAMQFTIGKLAAAGGVGVETIRYYQRRGLLGKIGRAHVCTPVTNAQLVCRLLLEKNNKHITRFTMDTNS